jgi:hypothetical protein
MHRARTLRRLLPVASLLATASCGSPSPAPAAPAQPATSAATATASDDAGAPAPSAGAEKDAAATAEAPEPQKIDECAPVAAAFEASVRPKMRKCWLDAAKKKPNELIVGEVKYLVEVDSMGKVVPPHLVGDKSTLPVDVIACMTKIVRAEKLSEPMKCAMKTVTVGEKFPR